MTQAAQAETTKPVALRQSVGALAGLMTDILGSAGLAVLDAEDEAVWAVVVPVSRALRHADETLQRNGRSARRLDTARQGLLSAAAALVDPAGLEGRWGSPRGLAVVVPGPGPLPTGIVECQMEARVRTLRWYPTEPDGSQGVLFAQLAGRPDGYRYRWADKTVWDDLAGDLIVFCCGWATEPGSVPPVLKRARSLLANQLRIDFGSGLWALDARQVVDWLVAAGIVTRMPGLTPQPVT